MIFFFFFLIESGNLLIIPYMLTKFQAPSSNTFRDLQDFMPIFSKGHNSRKGENSDKIKNTDQLFFHEESIYEISKP